MLLDSLDHPRQKRYTIGELDPGDRKKRYTAGETDPGERSGTQLARWIQVNWRDGSRRKKRYKTGKMDPGERSGTQLASWIMEKEVVYYLRAGSWQLASRIGRRKRYTIDELDPGGRQKRYIIGGLDPDERNDTQSASCIQAKEAVLNWRAASR